MNDKKTLKVIFQTSEEFFSDVKNQIKEGIAEGGWEEDYCVRFDGQSSLDSLLTPARLRILYVIKQHHPESVSKLAAILNRDFATVLRDCRRLVESNFIKLTKSKAGSRDSFRPELRFDYDVIIVPGGCSYIISGEVEKMLA